MKLKTKRKINSKTFKFFQSKKTVFVLPKINTRKLKMFWRQYKYNFANWKLNHLRKQVLEKETKIRINPKFKTLNPKQAQNPKSKYFFH